MALKTRLETPPQICNNSMQASSLWKITMWPNHVWRVTNQEESQLLCESESSRSLLKYFPEESQSSYDLVELIHTRVISSCWFGNSSL